MLRKMLPAQHPSADSGKLSAFTTEAAGLSETSIHIYLTLQHQISAYSKCKVTPKQAYVALRAPVG
jgi:hypothetical protein